MPRKRRVGHRVHRAGVRLVGEGDGRGEERERGDARAVEAGQAHLLLARHNRRLRQCSGARGVGRVRKGQAALSGARGGGGTKRTQLPPAALTFSTLSLARA